MMEISKTPLLKTKIPDGETFTDDDKAWEYFKEMNFDVILSNPPFAGEVSVRKQLVNYDLAKPALKRAKDKKPKEERDVIFIERIIQMLLPGGRAAIVLPQGKFNNSSLAFIREWILRKARLLAVVGLHGNSFKPHTGTKTSVLFIKKYTDEQLADIENVQKEVESKCPDYEKQIQDLITKFETEIEIPEKEITEEIFELLLEEYPEPEIEEDATEGVDEDNESLTLEEKLEKTRNDLLTKEQKLKKDLKSIENIAKKEKENLTKERDTWKGRYTKETIKRSLVDACNIKGQRAYNPSPIVALLKDSTKLVDELDRKSTRLNSSHIPLSRMPSSA